MSYKDDIEKLVQEKLIRKFKEKTQPENPPKIKYDRKYEEWKEEQQRRSQASDQYHAKISPLIKLHNKLEKISLKYEMPPPKLWKYKMEWAFQKVSLKDRILNLGYSFVEIEGEPHSWQKCDATGEGAREYNDGKNPYWNSKSGSWDIPLAVIGIPVSPRKDLHLFKKGNVQNFQLIVMDTTEPRSIEPSFDLYRAVRKQKWEERSDVNDTYLIWRDQLEEKNTLKKSLYSLNVLKHYENLIAEQIAEQKIAQGWTPPER